jgi:hypothetical protein
MSVTYKVIDGSSWQWAEEYVGLSATYWISCPPGRSCQVGMGLFMLGQPRGEKIRFSGEKEITVFGAGALHFRVDDDKGPCKIGFASKNVRPLSWTWDN